MGTSMGRLASLGGGSERLRWRLAPALTVFLTAIFTGGSSATAQSTMDRAVLGTIVESGAVQIANEPGAWTPGGNGTPVVEDSELRTGSGRTTLVVLGRHGVIGLRERTHLSVGRSGLDGLPLSVHGEGSFSFRLPVTTGLTFFTDAAVVKGPVAEARPGEDTPIQGVVAQRGNETTVRVIKGNLRVRNRGSEQFVSVGSGEQASIATAQEPPRIARMSEASEEKVRRRLVPVGLPGTKTGLAVAGTAAAGIGIGAAAATGAFSGDGSADETSVPTAASPFTP